MTIVAVMMTCSYMTVAYGRHVSWQLLGVTFAAFQGGLGEASTLALCSLYDSRRALTLWSSGTGFAGILLPASCLSYAVACAQSVVVDPCDAQEDASMCLIALSEKCYFGQFPKSADYINLRKPQHTTKLILTAGLKPKLAAMYIFSMCVNTWCAAVCMWSSPLPVCWLTCKSRVYS